MYFVALANNMWPAYFTGATNSDSPLPRPSDRSINGAAARDGYSFIISAGPGSISVCTT